MRSDTPLVKRMMSDFEWIDLGSEPRSGGSLARCLPLAFSLSIVKKIWIGYEGRNGTCRTSVGGTR